VAGCLVNVEEAAVTYEVAVGLDREVRLVARRLAASLSKSLCRRSRVVGRGGSPPPASSTSTSL
jgi:hypothetical protein